MFVATDLYMVSTILTRMARQGYSGVTLKNDCVDKIEVIRRREGLRSRSQTIQALVKGYENRNRIDLSKEKNAPSGNHTQNRPFTAFKAWENNLHAACM